MKYLKEETESRCSDIRRNSGENLPGGYAGAFLCQQNAGIRRLQKNLYGTAE